MAKQSETPKKFRPERPIYLNEQNTQFKHPDAVIEAVEKLRSRGWLCAYGEKSRPFHMCFNAEPEFQEFKKDAESLGIKLKSPVLKADEIEELEQSDNDTGINPADLATNSSEDPNGKVHIS